MTETEKKLANARLDLLAVIQIAKYALRHAEKRDPVDRRIAELLKGTIEVVEAAHR